MGESLGVELGEGLGSTVGALVGESVGVTVGDSVSLVGAGVSLFPKVGLDVISSTVGDMVIP